MVATDMFQLLWCDAVYCWHTGVCSLGFPSFWMQEFSASHPSLAPPLSPVSLNADSWAMACPGRSNNWKTWLLAAGGAAICESEWFGECCVRGRGGRGLRESQTASRGELLTPHRCQKAPRWPFAEPRLQIRKKGWLSHCEANINTCCYESCQHYQEGKTQQKYGSSICI